MCGRLEVHRQVRRPGTLHEAVKSVPVKRVVRGRGVTDAKPYVNKHRTVIKGSFYGFREPVQARDFEKIELNAVFVQQKAERRGIVTPKLQKL